MNIIRKYKYNKYDFLKLKQKKYSNKKYLLTIIVFKTPKNYNIKTCALICQ